MLRLQNGTVFFCSAEWQLWENDMLSVGSEWAGFLFSEWAVFVSDLLCQKEKLTGQREVKILIRDRRNVFFPSLSSSEIISAYNLFRTVIHHLFASLKGIPAYLQSIQAKSVKMSKK